MTPPTLRQFQIDAFASEPFRGNPAAVVPLDSWLPDEVMQAVAAENNLSETAFLVPLAAEGPHGASAADFHLRWFTPTMEVNLCGHATLASAHVLYEHLGWKTDEVAFHTRAGQLLARRRGDELLLDFPRIQITDEEISDTLTQALGRRPLELYVADDPVYDEPTRLAVFAAEEDVSHLSPDFRALGRMGIGVVATAPGNAPDVDFVSRFFATFAGIDEDPVTGSVHCMLAPYWGRRLGRSTLSARQISRRGGQLGCVVRGDRVELSGRAVTFLEGTIRVTSS